jgi:predicted nucleic acid-binding Zn ribbon protein
MESIKKLINASLDRHNITRQVKAATICAAWQKEAAGILTSEIAAEIEIISFKKGTLKVAVPGPSFSQAVKLQESQLIDNINKKLNKKTVERINPVVSY